ncbi:RICIN domain-containing protein [Streptomyces sp. NPDC026092]|uniref:RICIN domain-containing protein n=1 Tax=Streptomyces sp. NPDC026092 TaxID=3154797 RepID=UPI0033CE3F8B
MKFNPFTRARRGLLVLAASLGLALGVAAVPAQAAPSLVYLATVEIKAEHSGQCLEVADWSKANGAAVRQWPCTGGDNQKWHRYSQQNDNGAFYYVNVNSGKCLEIGGWGRNNGATANQWDCHWGLNQVFRGQYNLSMDHAYVYGKCLEIADWSTQPGAPARLWSCTYQPNQSFSIKAVDW